MTTPTGNAFSRRTVLRGGAALACSRAVGSPAPAIHARRKPTLRVLGTHVTLQEPLRVAAQRDLGINIEFSPGGSASVLQQASTSPASFDIYEQWSNSLPILWDAGSVKGIERGRIERWSEINDLCKTGRLKPDDPLGAGAAPYRMLYVDADGATTSKKSDLISFLPYVHNVDSFGYNAEAVGRGVAYDSESWGWLLDERWAGKVAIVNEPTIGLFDMALAAQARGLIEFPDVGNISEPKLDELFELLIRMKRDGHFSGFWNSVPHSVDLMSSGRVVIESMFSPAAAQLQGSGHDVVYAAPREGYRAWHGVMCLSSAVDEETEEAAYAYMNWWLSGWPGAFVARQGYYISNPDQAASFLTTPEWDYWYRGEPANEVLNGTDGRPCVAPGATRRGGSYGERLGHVAVWNTVMDTYEYSLGRWFSLLNA